jgi:protein-tyrosine-phosphatase
LAGDVQSIVFVCGQNAVRSPMARALTESLYPGLYRTASAGVLRGDRDPFVDAVLAEIGLDIGDHEPTAIEDLGPLDYDLAITLSPEAHHRTLEMTRDGGIEVEYWPTPDPTGAFGSREQILSAYRELRERLAARLRERFGEPPGPLRDDPAGEQPPR